MSYYNKQQPPWESERAYEERERQVRAGKVPLVHLLYLTYSSYISLVMISMEGSQEIRQRGTSHRTTHLTVYTRFVICPGSGENECPAEPWEATVACRQ